MRKKIPQILIIFFLIVFVIQIASLIFLLLEPNIGQAAIQFKPQVDIGAGVGSVSNEGNSIGQYIRAIYNYAIGIIGILATVVMMIGGIVWITAGGNNVRISEAKSWIGASLTGLVLALTSYTILAAVSPNLVNFQNPTIKKANQEELKNTAFCVDNSDCAGSGSGIVVCLTSMGVCSDLKVGSPCSGTCDTGTCVGNVCTEITSSMPRSMVTPPPVNSCANKSSGVPCVLPDGASGCCLQHNCYPPPSYSNQTGETCNP